MPISGAKASDASKNVGSSAPNATGRSTFRPPWVKETPKTDTVPWSKRNSTTTAPTPAPNGAAKEVKLQSREIKVPVTITPRKTSIPAEPLVKPKPKEVKVTVPEDNYKTSSEESSYEEVTDEEETEESGSEEEESEENETELKGKLAIQVQLKPVSKPNEVKKSPSVDRAGKFVKPALRKVPTLDKLDKPRPPPTIPEKKVLRTVPKPEFKEPPEKEEKEFVRPPLRKVDSTTKKRKPIRFISF